jgi:flagellin-like hook-associated protein FlgL
VGSFDRVIAGLIKEMEKFLGTMKTKVVAEASETNGSF